MGKLFGTDGIRGVANKELSVDLAMEVAQAAGTVIKEKIGRKPRFVIGRDTRLSSSMLESAMAAASGGANRLELCSGPLFGRL